ncbi:hypothetical protein MBLNU230_g5853t1 [Neophaeotheca triangularis]
MDPSVDEDEQESPGGTLHRTESNDESPKKSTKAQSEREKRTYRACLHCRQRKSRCDLYGSGEPGKPPCERCIREQHECILGGSRRGGKRVKRSHSDASTAPSGAQPASIEGLSQPQPAANSSASAQGNAPGLGQWKSNTSDGKLPPWVESRSLPPPPTADFSARSGTPSKPVVDDDTAMADLQNPADALEFLANVAERNSSITQLPPMSAIAGLSQGIPRDDNYARTGINVEYPPLQNGGISIENVYILLQRYRQKYNPFFPICNPAAMEPNNLQQIAKDEPHLLSAILTVASKDEKHWWQMHEVCSSHMQTLLGNLTYSGAATVEAVEATLILAEWPPRRPQAMTAVGKGEEDQAAWMLVGAAIRLGYLLSIDRTGFRTEYDSKSPDLNRGRLAWAACYMCDRQISIRLGKAFWSRGPGPMTSLQARDFPSLQPRPDRQDDFAAIFEANLELTQLFSNAHDVLYATKSRSNQLNYGGEYVKYIDDFRVSLRSWLANWGSLHCSPELRASLDLSYEYLRLYINAFAYQATLNRLVARMQEAAASGKKTPLYPFADVAATPDARFVYEAIEAAKALLTTFTTSVDPVETFRFMPLRYYLYVIYSATFLYKARSTGVMAGDNRDNVKTLIAETVDRLQKASACANDVGERYARLIRLLWRRPPGGGRSKTSKSSTATNNSNTNSNSTNPPSNPRTFSNSNPTSTPSQHNQSLQTQNPHSQNLLYPTDSHQQQQSQNLHRPSINTFSWLDLPAVGEFATNNNDGSISGASMHSNDFPLNNNNNNNNNNDFNNNGGNGGNNNNSNGGVDFFMDDGSMDGFVPELLLGGFADGSGGLNGGGGGGSGPDGNAFWGGGGQGGFGSGAAGMGGMGMGGVGGMGVIF